ncbi:hypothetical protein BH10PSE19_BH10PSE19_13280 [soil metagenome]
MLHTATKAPAAKLSDECAAALQNLDEALIENLSTVPQCEAAHGQVSRLLQADFKPQATDFQRLGQALEFVDGLHPDSPLKKAKDNALAALAAAGISLVPQPSFQHNNSKLFWVIEAGKANDLGLKFVKNEAGVYLVSNPEGKLLFEVRKGNTFILHDDSDEAFEKSLQLALKGLEPGKQFVASLHGFPVEAEKRFLAIATKLGIMVIGEHVSSPQLENKAALEGVATKTLETSAPTPSPSGARAKEEDEEESKSSAPTPKPLGSIMG